MEKCGRPAGSIRVQDRVMRLSCWALLTFLTADGGRERRKEGKVVFNHIVSVFD
jgi:hypothetical protein